MIAPQLFTSEQIQDALHDMITKLYDNATLYLSGPGKVEPEPEMIIAYVVNEYIACIEEQMSQDESASTICSEYDEHSCSIPVPATKTIPLSTYKKLSLPHKPIEKEAS